MLKLASAALLCLLLAPSAMADEKLPADVVQYIDRRESCDHWRGEDGYDEARRAEIVRAVCRSCSGSDAGLARLTKKYKANKRVLARLADFEPQIESPAEGQKNSFCQSAPKGERARRAAPSAR